MKNNVGLCVRSLVELQVRTDRRSRISRRVQRFQSWSRTEKGRHCMSETYQEYRARVLGYLGDRDPIRVLQSTPRKIERLLNGVPRRMLARRPIQRKWSVVEILAHLADAELAIGWRFRNMIATPGVTLQWWDEHLWSQKCHYAQMDPDVHSGFFKNSVRVILRSCGRYHKRFGGHLTKFRKNVDDKPLQSS